MSPGRAQTPASAPGKKKRPFTGGGASCFTDTLEWTPDGEVYGQYEIQTSAMAGVWGANCSCNANETCVYATLDVDGDGLVIEDLEAFFGKVAMPQPMVCIPVGS